MGNYQDIDINKAYKLVGHGPLVWVSTISEKEEFDLAPIAWNCLVAKEPARILIAVGNSHKTYANIRETKGFIVSVPNILQVELVRETGSVSGDKVDKFEEFCIEHEFGRVVKAKIPLHCLGFAECKLIQTFTSGDVGLFVGECMRSGISDECYKNGRITVENRQAKTLHHLGNKVFAVPADQVDTGLSVDS